MFLPYSFSDSLAETVAAGLNLSHAGSPSAYMYICNRDISLFKTGRIWIFDPSSLFASTHPNKRTKKATGYEKERAFFFIFKNILSKFIMKYFFRQEKKRLPKRNLFK